MLPFKDTHESNRTHPNVNPADVARGEKQDLEAGTTESGSKGENVAKSVVQRVSGGSVSL